jgi:hypothetical protein
MAGKRRTPNPGRTPDPGRPDRRRGRLAARAAAAARGAAAAGRRATAAGHQASARASAAGRLGTVSAGRLGAASAGRRTLAAGRRAAAAAGRRGLAVARGETARRLGRLAALTLALAVLVVVLYEHGDVPSAAARPAAGDPRAATAPQGPGRAATRPRAAPRPPAAADGRAGAGERTVRPAKPAEVAAAWYAARHGLPRNRVRALQQDRLSARRARVLVLADAGKGRLRTALVHVRLGPSGWEVR